jgi:hypothetical protein
MRPLSKIPFGLLAVITAIFSGSAAFAANTDTAFKQAYAAADAAETEAGRLRNQWLATEAALTEARKAAEKKDFDRAFAAAKEAEALAKASIFQATSEKEAWKNLEIRP